MQRTVNASPLPTNALVFGGDWACAHGDIDALAQMAKQLSDRFADPLRIELVELSQLCQADHDRAATRWAQLRHQLSDELHHHHATTQ